MGEAKEHKMEMPRGYWMADRYAALLSSLNCKSVQCTFKLYNMCIVQRTLYTCIYNVYYTYIYNNTPPAGFSCIGSNIVPVLSLNVDFCSNCYLSAVCGFRGIFIKLQLRL